MLRKSKGSNTIDADFAFRTLNRTWGRAFPFRSKHDHAWTSLNSGNADLLSVTQTQKFILLCTLPTGPPHAGVPFPPRQTHAPSCPTPITPKTPLEFERAEFHTVLQKPTNPDAQTQDGYRGAAEPAYRAERLIPCAKTEQSPLPPTSLTCNPLSSKSEDRMRHCIFLFGRTRSCPGFPQLWR